MATTISPALMPKTRIKSLKELRGYDLGERNPKTLPFVYKDSESSGNNAVRSAHWDRTRRLVEAGKFIGSKY